jgi:hypothetical protein
MWIQLARAWNGLCWIIRWNLANKIHMVECNVFWDVGVQDFEVAKQCEHKMNVHIWLLTQQKHDQVIGFSDQHFVFLKSIKW